MRNRLFLSLGLLAASVPFASRVRADEPLPYDLAISRLRGCVTAGAAGAPRDNRHAAVVAVRSLCRPQIDNAYAASDRQVAANHQRADGGTLSNLQQQARRKIDYDLARLVSSHAGFGL
jgi:hypothetical protein